MQYLQFTAETVNLIGIVGLILTAAGTYATIRSKLKIQLTITKCHNKEILTKPAKERESIKIQHNGREIEGINSLEITLKNTGNCALRKTDFPFTPYIYFKHDVDIMSLECASSDEHNKPKISKKGNLIEFDFCFLEKNESMVIKIVYSNSTSCAGGINYKIINGTNTEYNFATNIERELRKKNKPFFGMLTAISMFIIFLFLFILPHKLGLISEDQRVTLGEYLPYVAVIYIMFGMYFEAKILAKLEQKTIEEMVKSDIVKKESLLTKIED